MHLETLQSCITWVSTQNFEFFAECVAGVVLVGAVKSIVSRMREIWG